jgi:hypothetical protein
MASSPTCQKPNSLLSVPFAKELDNTLVGDLLNLSGKSSGSHFYIVLMVVDSESMNEYRVREMYKPKVE